MSSFTLTLFGVPVSLVFSSQLQNQQQKSWQRFHEQHPEACCQLSLEQLNYFKQAIALSDFILNSALQAPDLVLPLFTQKDKLLPFTSSLF